MIRIEQPTRDRGGEGGPQASAEDEFLTVLLAMAAHDLRQPLQVLMGTQSRLEQIVTGMAEREFLRRGGMAIEQLLDQFDRLADMLRLHQRVSSLELGEVAVAPIFTQLVHEHADAARQKGIELRVCRTGKTVHSEATLLTVALRNLVRNALKYTPGGGRVLLGCRSRGPDVSIEIIDTGGGIPADQFSRIFEAFHRLGSTRSDGLGIGLFVVRRIVDLLGHGISVDSRVGCGSRFAVHARTPLAAQDPPPCLLRRRHHRRSRSHTSSAINPSSTESRKPDSQKFVATRS
jgi:signal transduction histidine kinase